MKKLTESVLWQYRACFGEAFFLVTQHNKYTQGVSYSMDQATSNKTNQHISRWLFMPFSSNLHARNIAAALLRAEVLSACCRHSSAVLWFGRGAGGSQLA